MESLDLRVLADALAWHQAGHAVTLVTVVETWGSAPRPSGALLALRDDGHLSGSVSGGCVEDDLIARTRASVRSGDTSTKSTPSMVTYGVSKDEAARFGLPCGGTLRLLQEPLMDTAWLKELLTRTAAHELVTRTVHLPTGRVTLTPGLRTSKARFTEHEWSSTFGPQWRLLLVGAGQLSQAVAHIATLLDFAVLICDPREEYASAWPHQSARVNHLPGMPDDVVRDMQPDAHTAIVALTHDPKLDDMALMEALKSNAFYVGALGSRRNQTARKARLGMHFGLSEIELSRLHGPVGLDIGAQTPAEIAVSIVAHIVEHKYCAGATLSANKTIAESSTRCCL
ncbi:XdhC family protein [Rhodoferax aquaticus]|uniref:XdhC family protein n=1 Tax=Rhodoferax aquaticus TaxID=2527691 RepID=A0A515EP51_9BURK|nr:XdhC family protein [Rhodoferax aquaticus]QDL54447.1 XdhC family protein [Rhodoferax aquaticus]